MRNDVDDDTYDDRQHCTRSSVGAEEAGSNHADFGSLDFRRGQTIADPTRNIKPFVIMVIQLLQQLGADSTQTCLYIESDQIFTGWHTNCMAPMHLTNGDIQ